MKHVLAAGAAVHLPLLSFGAAGSEPTNSKAGCESPPAHPSGAALQRRAAAHSLRIRAALEQFKQPLPAHPNNGDEARYPAFAPFSKGLPHNALGEIEAGAYRTYRHALDSGDPADFEKIILGCTAPGQSLLDNPQAGLAFDLEGKDSHATFLPPPPAFSSNEEAAEIIENYWMALARDIPFAHYATHSIIADAAKDLSALSDFRGPKIGGQVTPATLFRGALRGEAAGAFRPIPGCLAGPYISQFLWLDVPFGVNYFTQQMQTTVPGVDYLTDPAEWLAVQNGCPPSTPQQYSPDRRYLCTGRDLGQWVHVDVLHQAYFQAMLILLGLGARPNPGNPYLGSATQQGFGTFGVPHIASLLPEVCTRALHAVWFQKWWVHRRLRPEEYGGHIHHALAGHATYPLPPDLNRSAVLGRVHRAHGAYLLPMAFAEGAPLHPSYGSGHATVAGACVTVLKAWFDGRQRISELIRPVEAGASGQALGYYTGADADQLTVEGELNKLAANIALGRDFAGVHWRSDQMESLALGEDVALSILRDQRLTYNEAFQGWTFRRFDGSPVTV